VRQGLGALRGHPDVLEDVGDGGVLGDEGDDSHFSGTKGHSIGSISTPV
jgi:hypothetical protein